MQENIVIVGSGHAGVNLAANLRKKNWIGSISLISDEKYLPYHRPPFIKNLPPNSYVHKSTVIKT